MGGKSSKAHFAHGYIYIEVDQSIYTAGDILNGIVHIDLK